MAVKWTIWEMRFLQRQKEETYTCITSWNIVAKNINYFMYTDFKINNNRTASACRHKYYELKRKQILYDIGNLPQEEKYRLIYKLLASDGIR